MLSIGSSVLYLFTDVVDQRRVLIFDALDYGLKLGLHCFVVVARDLVTELVVSMNAALVADRQVTAQELQLFVREMMVEEEVT